MSAPAVNPPPRAAPHDAGCPAVTLPGPRFAAEGPRGIALFRSPSAVDDLVTGLQGAIDRLVRRLRRGAPPEPGRRRLLVVQIDGLSQSVLEEALARGLMPHLRKLLRRGGLRLTPMSVGLPTSTPAFQLAAMYGVKPDIPGFHYHDRRRGADVYFPRVGHAAAVEVAQAAGRPGILTEGSSYGCVFSGGAERDVFTFAMLWRPSGRGLVAVTSGLVVLTWVLVKGFWLSGAQVVRAVARWARHPRRERARGWRWLAIQLGCSVWLRQLYTLAAAADLYAGVPAIYVSSIDYDVFAHGLGPRHRQALRGLRGIDASIHQLSSVLRRVPEHGYDLFVLSDHGQTATTPYQNLHAGTPLEQALFDEILGRRVTVATLPAHRPGTPIGWLRAYLGLPRGFLQRFVNYLESDFPWTVGEVREARQRGGVRVIAAGPNAFVYFLDSTEPLGIETIDARFPGLVDEISRHRGVGFVLARSVGGPVCVWQGKRAVLGEEDAGPFAGSPDAGLVLSGIRDLMAMPSAGDLVIYGHGGAGEGNVSYIREVGAHAGPSAEEMRTFIVHPRHIAMPGPIEHPVQLYPILAVYAAEPAAAEPATPRPAGR